MHRHPIHPKNVTCPTCGARPGFPCVNAWGYAMAEFHQARVDLAGGRVQR